MLGDLGVEECDGVGDGEREVSRDSGGDGLGNGVSVDANEMSGSEWKESGSSCGVGEGVDCRVASRYQSSRFTGLLGLFPTRVFSMSWIYGSLSSSSSDS